MQEARRIYFSGEIDNILNAIEKLNARNQGRWLTPGEGWMFDTPGPRLHELGHL